MFIPDPPDPSWFRFTTYDLDKYCDGTWHCLQQGVDFPAEITLGSIRKRLHGAAGTRNMSCAIRIDGTRICFVFILRPEFPNSGPLYF